jgi:hypothetical protein
MRKHPFRITVEACAKRKDLAKLFSLGIWGLERGVLRRRTV